MSLKSWRREKKGKELRSTIKDSEEAIAEAGELIKANSIKCKVGVHNKLKSKREGEKEEMKFAKIGNRIEL